MSPRLLFAALCLMLSACDIPGLGPDPRIIQREAEGKAIGGGCRHAQRGIEECYQRNPKASKTAIFEGWREMDGYMRDNKLSGLATEAQSEQSDQSGEDAEADSASASKVEEQKRPAPEAKPAVAAKKRQAPI